jgi:jumonji domain-containing protein 7
MCCICLLCGEFPSGVGGGFWLRWDRYHKVSQSCSEEGICCAVNYWYVLCIWGVGEADDVTRYDMEFGGSFYPLCNFSRSVALAALAT